MYYRVQIWDMAPHLAPYNGQPFSCYGYATAVIYADNNEHIDSESFRTLDRAHLWAREQVRWHSEIVADSAPRYTVRYRPFSGMWCVQDTYALASNRRGTLAPYIPVIVKEYRTERAAHALAQRLNTADQSSAA